MLTARGYKILGDLSRYKFRTVLVCASIFVGVFSVIALFSLGDILISRLNATIKEENLPMLTHYVTVNPRAGVAEPNDLTPLRAIEGVEVLQAVLVQPIYWRLPQNEEFTQGRIFAHSEPFESIPIQPVVLVSGEYPEEGQQEVAVERRFASANNLGVGDTLIVRVLVGGSQELREESVTISGIVFLAYSYPTAPGAPTLIAPDTMIFAHPSDAQRITGTHGYTIIQSRFTDFATAEASTSRFSGTMILTTPYVPVVTLVEDPANNNFIGQIETFGQAVSMLAIVSLVVSGFLVYNVINTVIVEERRQIGILKSLGANGWENFSIYAGMALIFGIIGVIPGVVLGIPGGFAAAKNLAPQVNIFISDFMISPRAIIVGILLGLFVPVAAAALPVFSGIRVTILEAITDLGISSHYGGSLLTRLLDRIPLPTSIQQALRNILQKKSRLALTMVTLALAAGAFMGVYSMVLSFDDLLDNIFGTINYQITINPANVEDYERIITLVNQDVGGLHSLEPGVVLAVDVDDYRPRSIAAAPALLLGFGFNTRNPDLMRFDLVSGSAWRDDPERRGVVLSISVAEGVGKSAGDSVNIAIGNASAEFEILGVASYAFDAIWMPWEELAVMAGLVDGQGAPVPNSIQVKLEGNRPGVRQVSSKIEEINTLLLENNINARYDNWVETQEQIAALLDSSALIMNMSTAMIGLVGAIGLLSTLSMSVFERQKEIGVMRSIGATSALIAVQFLVEGLIVGLVAWAIGLPLSFALNDALIEAFGLGEIAGLGYVPATILVGFLAMLGITITASLWPSTAAARKTVSDILRYQ